MSPRAFERYFWLAAALHGASIATRYEPVASRLPAALVLAAMIAQFPLLLLTGFFESRIERGGSDRSPLWMRIESDTLKGALVLALIYLAVVIAQTWDLAVGSIDPSPAPNGGLPPALSFAMFCGLLIVPAYFGGLAVLVPVLRHLTRPFRALPLGVGAFCALGLGFVVGMIVYALVTSSRVAEFVAEVRGTIAGDPALAIGVTLAMTLVPLAVGLAAGRRR